MKTKQTAAILLSSAAISLSLSSCFGGPYSGVTTVEVLMKDAGQNPVVATVSISVDGNNIDSYWVDEQTQRAKHEMDKIFAGSQLTTDIDQALVTSPGDKSVQEVSALATKALTNAGWGRWTGVTYSISSVKIVDTLEMCELNIASWLKAQEPNRYTGGYCAPDNDLPGTPGWGMATVVFEDAKLTEMYGVPAQRFLNVNTLLTGSPKDKPVETAAQQARLDGIAALRGQQEVDRVRAENPQPIMGGGYPMTPATHPNHPDPKPAPTTP